MPELISIAARLRAFIGNRRHAPRRQARLAFSVSSAGGKKNYHGARSAELEGYTRDISLSGLSIIVPAIRSGSYYFTDQDRTLHIKLCLLYTSDAADE